MNPDPYPSLSERAEELEVAAHKAETRGDQYHAELLKHEAKTLREQAAAVEARRLAGG
jgi:hypothetical protein